MSQSNEDAVAARTKAIGADLVASGESMKFRTTILIEYLRARGDQDGIDKVCDLMLTMASHIDLHLRILALYGPQEERV